MRESKTTAEERQYMKDYYKKNKDRLYEYKKLVSKKNLYTKEEYAEQYYLYLKKYEIGLFKANKQIDLRTEVNRYDKGAKIKKLSKEIKTTIISFT